MSASTWNRLSALSGLAFVVLVALMLVLGGNTPGTDDSAAAVASYYAENEVSQFAATFVLTATVPFLVLFGVTLAAVARREGRSSTWGRVAVAGAIVTGAAILVTALVHFALADLASRDDASAAAVLALNALDGSTWVAFNAGFGVLMLGAAGSLLTGGVMRPLGWIALVLGVAAFMPFVDFFALLATLVWIAVVSVALARRASARAREPQLAGDSLAGTA